MIPNTKRGGGRSSKTLVDESKDAANAMVGGHEAIAIGLVGMDEEHNSGNEIHPVHAWRFEARHLRTGPGCPQYAGRSLVDLVRNWGDEGYVQRTTST